MIRFCVDFSFFFCITVRLAVLSFLLYTTVTITNEKIEFNFPLDPIQIKNRQIKFAFKKRRPATVIRKHELMHASDDNVDDDGEEHDADGPSPNQSRLRFKLNNEMRTKLADSIASPLDKYLPIFDPRAK